MDLGDASTSLASSTSTSPRAATDAPARHGRRGRFLWHQHVLVVLLLRGLVFMFILSGMFGLVCVFHMVLVFRSRWGWSCRSSTICYLHFAMRCWSVVALAVAHSAICSLFAWLLACRSSVSICLVATLATVLELMVLEYPPCGSHVIPKVLTHHLNLPLRLCTRTQMVPPLCSCHQSKVSNFWHLSGFGDPLQHLDTAFACFSWWTIFPSGLPFGLSKTPSVGMCRDLGKLQRAPIADRSKKGS